jgi:hypothetical protein
LTPTEKPVNPRLWPIAIGLLGIGLLSASMVGMVYVSKLDDLQRRGHQVATADWSVLRRFERQTVRTGGVGFTVQRVYLFDEVNPILRDPARGACQEMIVLKIQARNFTSEPVMILPGIFKLSASDANVSQGYAQGFKEPRLAAGGERTYTLGFMAPTTALPCVLWIDGDPLRPGAVGEEARYNGVIDVCTGTL